ncbi:homeobox protein ceh-9-like [Daktulosphaira vitifoliae]|uniref:homeobox protein ceh-9-like n=1 Tax=Daktulosphaira vitifoliae TaxID=58002 RepID=UPI0021A9DA90|nr:homeobox protein ceh-9-like [Daktulosphaira vitifoliae]XP_050533466.1 homeobox protein ceh-9-like [Daktulosphaira vitifoliae]XP_050533474.1 homeobox protein ceh-9-like [Daktulosphaira vitifoliae]
MECFEKYEGQEVVLPEQVLDILESQFNKAKTLHTTDLEILAAELGVREVDVKIWYTNRIAAWRRSQGLSDCFGQL